MVEIMRVKCILKVNVSNVKKYNPISLNGRGNVVLRDCGII